jgi:hypothetical protein
LSACGRSNAGLAIATDNYLAGVENRNHPNACTGTLLRKHALSSCYPETADL